MWFNAFITPILMSPFHAVFSKHMLLLSVTGTKSGKVITLPVNYFKMDTHFYVISWRERTWWRNLRKQAQVRILHKGKVIAGWGKAITDNAVLMDELVKLFTAYPQLPAQLKLQPENGMLASAAEKIVLVKLWTAPEAATVPAID